MRRRRAVGKQLDLDPSATHETHPAERVGQESRDNYRVRKQPRNLGDPYIPPVCTFDVPVEALEIRVRVRGRE